MRRSGAWARWSDERLLNARLSDLRLGSGGALINPALARLTQDLAARNIAFRPHWWLSDCWFSPDGVPGFAIPFYLAHPRLMQLEQQHMLEVEGGTPESCLKIMRHETAHALANGYRLHLRQAWRRRFGRASRTYPESYLPRPGSRSYVVHLDHWYAQSHPAEDWAETFAVWLDPRSRWRERYQGWPAMKKLEYVDLLMQEIHAHTPPVRTRRQVEGLNTLSYTLGEYFEQKQARLRADFPRFHEEQLRQIFPASKPAKRERASRFIRRLKREMMTTVAAWTSDSRYRIHLTLEHMANRCDELDLSVGRDPEDNRTALVAALVMLYMGSLRSGTSRLAL
jgi:hypothetical protein